MWKVKHLKRLNNVLEIKPQKLDQVHSIWAGLKDSKHFAGRQDMELYSRLAGRV